MTIAATAVNQPCQAEVTRAERTTLRKFACLAIILIGATTVRAESADDERPVRRIGATTSVVEVASGVEFPARVDTGATSCSIHCDEIDIKDPEPKAEDNVGKPVRILITSPEGEEHWVKTKIADHVVVRTSERADERYKVPLKLRWQEVEKKVLVTLNNRRKMEFPLLLGRNFLHGDFLVDVTIEEDH